MWYTSSSGLIALKMTLSQAQSCSHSGQCDEDVKALMTVPAIARQLAKVDRAILAGELKEYGAWDEEERSDRQKNLERLVWLAACAIAEEAAQ